MKGNANPRRGQASKRPWCPLYYQAIKALVRELFPRSSKYRRNFRLFLVDLFCEAQRTPNYRQGCHLDVGELIGTKAALAERLDLPRSTFRDYLTRLEKAGVITIRTVQRTGSATPQAVITFGDFTTYVYVPEEVRQQMGKSATPSRHPPNESQVQPPQAPMASPKEAVRHPSPPASPKSSTPLETRNVDGAETPEGGGGPEGAKPPPQEQNDTSTTPESGDAALLLGGAAAPPSGAFEGEDPSPEWEASRRLELAGQLKPTRAREQKSRREGARRDDVVEPPEGHASPHEETKQCSKCGVIRPVTEFGKDARNRDGLCSACRACRKAYQKAYLETPRGRGARRASLARYNGSPAGKARTARYRRSAGAKGGGS